MNVIRNDLDGPVGYWINRFLSLVWQIVVLTQLLADNDLAIRASFFFLILYVVIVVDTLH